MSLLNFWRSSLDPERVLNTHVIHFQDLNRQEREEALTVEEPCEIRLGSQSLAVIMRTPGDDYELILGFLFSEGLIHLPEDVLSIRHASDDSGLPLANVIEVGLRPELMASIPGSLNQRTFPVASSCGLCGKESIAAVLCTTEPLPPDDLRIPAACLYTLPQRLRHAQKVFSHTGGLHAAALFTSEGELLVLREDVGRHNAVDKLLGYGIQHRSLPYQDALLLLSGRTSFEIIQKALRARIPCIAAISAPSSLAVELAARSGITLVGFLRERTMNIYSHPERILME